MPWATPSSSRSVRRLHLHAATEEDAARTATLLADALRTASIPGSDDGRLIVIRRLALGRLPHDMTSASLALHIERIATDVASRAVPYTSQAAAHADVVVCPSQGGAVVTLAHLLATGRQADEWFWPRIVRGWTADASPADGFRTLLDAAHALAGAVPLVAAIARNAAAAGREDWLRSIDVAHVRAWRRETGWRWPADVDRSVAPVLLTASHQGFVRRCAAGWGAHDERVLWLASMLAVAEHPPLIVDRELPSRVAAGLAASRPGSQVVEARSPLTRAKVTVDVEPVRDSALDGERSIAPFDHPATQASENVPGRTGDDAAVFTPYAGVWLVVPILMRLGLPDYVATHAQALDADFAVRVIAFIAHRAGMTSDDPLVELLGIERSELTREPPDEPFVSWLRGVRRWSRRYARIGLADLVRRPGTVRWSDTHLDVCFPLSQLDVRIRRIALDVNPGWVPWLRRVVSFHYLESRDGVS